MNRSPINAIAINGDVRKYMSAEAQLYVQSSLPITYGYGLGGDAVVRVQADYEALVLLFLEGEAEFQAHSDIEERVTAGVFGESTSDIEVDAGQDSKLNLRPTLDSEIVFDAGNEGLPIPGQNGQAKADIILDSELIGEVRPSPLIIGEGKISIGSKLSLDVSRSIRPDMSAGMFLSGWCDANLHMYSPSGHANVDILSDGALRIGGKPKLSGRADIVIKARGASDKWRHIHSGGTADIRILFAASGVGRPPIPEHYVPAHPHWRMKVAGDDWRFVVPKDRRRLP